MVEIGQKFSASGLEQIRRLSEIIRNGGDFSLIQALFWLKMVLQWSGQV